ncbi:D-alanyl-D-alanine carboxypeptidase [Shewanella dokdonensis]|uniref:D-alanyl-D-alanine carboxypeptidase n=1 Tax=Shewanella dokdonensis TaxID=712036 RepID=A0ABX8DE45_9GAMM|nr:D-alanyl-D-alanine carboxypeptidase [Shewanella dokdonensis]QVK23009.1 D-alanyl-D-alanine carboxypeptidase [Shewanella dokdonensis]
MTIRSNGLRRWTQGLTGLGWLLLSCSPSAAILPNWLQPLLPTDSQTALWVQDTHSGEVLVSHNPDVLMLPASTQKLLTAVTAWQVLGEDFRFHTRLYTTGKTENGILNGDLYLQFDGDPA